MGSRLLGNRDGVFRFFLPPLFIFVLALGGDLGRTSFFFFWQLCMIIKGGLQNVGERANGMDESRQNRPALLPAEAEKKRIRKGCMYIVPSSWKGKYMSVPWTECV